MMDEVLTHCTFLASESIPPFRPAMCANDGPSAQIYSTSISLSFFCGVCSRAFLAAIACGSVYFLSPSRKTDTPPLLSSALLHLYIDSSRDEGEPPLQERALELICGCVCLYVCVCDQAHMCSINILEPNVRGCAPVFGLGGVLKYGGWSATK